MKQHYAALSTQGTHTMHFFDTLKEAREYVVRTGGRWYVVRVLGETETNYIPIKEIKRIKIPND